MPIKKKRKKGTTKATGRDLKSEYSNYHSSPKAKKQRARNNKARRTALKNGTVKKGDGKDIAHTKPGARGGTFVQSASKNRSIKRTKTARRKGKG